MRQTRAAVFLASPDALASDFIREKELPYFLEHNGNELRFLWLPIHAAAYNLTELADIQAAHDPDQPLASLTKAESDKVLTELTSTIAAMLKQHRMGRSAR